MDVISGIHQFLSASGCGIDREGAVAVAVAPTPCGVCGFAAGETCEGL